jgi:hypothetical protein
MYNSFDPDLLTDLKNWCKSNPINISDYCEPLNIQKGKLNSFYGKKHTEETKQKISKVKKGTSYNKGSKRPWASENLKKIKHRAYGFYEIVEPNGNIVTVTNLKSYCKNHKLNYTTMSSLSNGKWEAGSYRGYKSKKLGYLKIHQ